MHVFISSIKIKNKELPFLSFQITTTTTEKNREDHDEE